MWRRRIWACPRHQAYSTPALPTVQTTATTLLQELTTRYENRFLWSNAHWRPSSMLEYLGGDASRLGQMSEEEKAELLLKAKTKQFADQFGKHRQTFTRAPETAEKAELCSKPRRSSSLTNSANIDKLIREHLRWRAIGTWIAHQRISAHLLGLPVQCLRSQRQAGQLDRSNHKAYQPPKMSSKSQRQTG